jgi:hypothetical protein
MSLRAIFKDLSPIELRLDQLFLDPNNPRFINETWTFIDDKRIEDPEVQETTRQLLIERFDVQRLRENIEVNGYLPIDRVIVREFSPKKYVVLEGNRRICAAKLVTDISADGTNVAADVLASLKKLPCLLYTGGERRAAWVFQGIRHITGYYDWPAFNKAKLLVEQMTENDLTLTEVGKRFGISSFGAGQWMRAYYAYKQASEESDYTDVVDEKSFPYFQELFSKSSSGTRDWMKWDEKEKKFQDNLNFNEFVGWLYPRPSQTELEAGETTKGSWDRRWIPRAIDIRNVAYLIKQSPTFFEQYRRDGDLEKAYAQATAKQFENQLKQDADPVKDAFESIQTCERALVNFPYRALKDDKIKARLLEELRRLSKAITELTN